MKLQINITREIFEKSKWCGYIPEQLNPRIGQNCAIGKAIYNLFGDKSWVGMEKIRFYKNPDGNYDYSEADYEAFLSPQAISFIEIFDLKTPEERVLMTPFSFEIDVPEEVIEWIGINEAKEIINNSKSLELV